jgi:hypothetical protein
MGYPIQGYETIGLAIFAVCAVLPLSVTLAFFRLYRRRKAAGQAQSRAPLLTVSAVMVVVYAAVTFDAFWIEPNWPVVEEVEVSGDVAAPLRILQLSDLHIEVESAPREQWLLEQLDALHPDLILLTGDIHQMGSDDVASVRHVLGGLRAPLGVYACIGFDQTSLVTEAAPQVTFLENKAVTLNHAGRSVGLCGLIGAGRREAVWAALRDHPYRIVMNHTPDLADEAAAHDADLYLAGHTHGGQVRIPFWGAIITLAQTGKKYEAGRYQSGQTTIYTSRGFGLEPRPAAQVRFLCRPEITLITVRPAGDFSS